MAKFNENSEFYNPLLDFNVDDTGNEQKYEIDSPKLKKKVNHRRTTEIIEIPDKILFRKAYGVEQFLERLRFDPPKRGCSMHVITGGNVDMICYVKYLLLHYRHMDRVLVSTWCLGGAELKMMEDWWKEGRIDSYDVLCGEHCRSQYKIEWAYLQRMKEAGIVNKLFCSTIHAKIILCQSGEDHIVVETSSNFNMNPRVEQGCVTMSSELFDFYDDYFKRMMKDDEEKEK